MSDVLDRFWAKVEVRGPDECWPWTAYVDEAGNGYGQFWNGSALVKAHRFSYEVFTGAPIPRGLVIDHICHNDSGCTDVPCLHRKCCNPRHLEATTQKINSIRGRAGDHQLAKTHCPKGHPYDDENTILLDGGKHRICRTCRQETCAAYYQRRKAKAA